jgi:hypothetical protein
MLLANIGSSRRSRNALSNRGPATRAVTMRPFGREVAAVEAAMVVRPVTDARALLRS